jgi:hypothetical protein
MANVSDTSSHRRDQIANFAEILENSKAKQKVFEAVYRGKKRSKAIGEIADATGYSAKRVAEIAGPLAREKLFEQGRGKHEGRKTTVYSKIDFVTTNRREILRLARNPKTLDRYHTKTNPRVAVRIASGHRVSLKVPFPIRTTQIHIEDMAEFAKTKAVKPKQFKMARLSENKTKRGILKILGEPRIPKDWGGENNDIFTNRITLRGKKRQAAFALKGPAKKGPLVPKMMGANGDQIQRLFDSPASVFLVQYEGEVKESIFKLMEQLAKAKAILGGEIFWGVIDDEATKRLRSAYPRAFPD